MEAAINSAINNQPLYDEGMQQSTKATVKAKAVSCNNGYSDRSTAVTTVTATAKAT
jgi:hypothetical protein